MPKKLRSSDQTNLTWLHFEPYLYYLSALIFHFPSKNKLTCQYPLRLSANNIVHWYSPDPEPPVAGNLFQRLVLEWGVREGYGPTAFQKVCTEVYTVAEARGFYPAPAHKTAVAIGCHYFAADKARNFEVQRYGRPRATKWRQLVPAAVVARAGNIDSVQVHGLATYSQAAVIVDDRRT